MEEIYGRDYSEMLAVLDFEELHEVLEELGPDDLPTVACISIMAGRDPDLASGTVAYVKGALFLRWLEDAVGRAGARPPPLGVVRDQRFSRAGCGWIP